MTKPTVEYDLFIESETIPIRGNLTVLGDAETDKAEEDKLIERLDSGDEYAWFCAHVTATVVVGDKVFVGHDYLGGCSYANEADFKAGGYWEDMKNSALEDLKADLKHAVEKGEVAAKALKIM